MPRSGTLVICVQNLDFSGANQVVLNIVADVVSNVVVVSPKVGSFASRFVDSGAAVRVGNLAALLVEIRDVFCILCNTIMTASIVVEMSSRSHPVIWILHEWWDDDMITENLRIRNMDGLTLKTVKQALERAAMVVFVCESQRQLYKPVAPSSVIFVGVPDPALRLSGTDTPTMGSGVSLAANGSSQAELLAAFQEKERIGAHQITAGRVFTFLCLGIVCPRKNQMWTIELFKQFARGKSNVRLVIVGARRTRLYEIEYLEKIQAAIGDDPTIELHDVTDNVDKYFAMADCLILTSLNEVTPMVISEAMSWCIPILSTNIAGISEMFTDGVEGYLFAPGETDKALYGMNRIYSDSDLRRMMSHAARIRYESIFELNLMVEAYQGLVLRVAPPVILVDMDGVIVDWDAGFMTVWDNEKAPVNRESSYFIEQCVAIEHNHAAELISLQKDFFGSLKPMKGAIQALQQMEDDGLEVFICTAPNLISQHCMQEKVNWVREYLGEKWVRRVIQTHDKTVVRGDILIDDKPFEFMYPGGKHSTASWKQIVFDALYNRQLLNQPRITDWREWRGVVYPLLGKAMPMVSTATDIISAEYGDIGTATAAIAGIPGIAEGDDETLSPTDLPAAMEFTNQYAYRGHPPLSSHKKKTAGGAVGIGKSKGYHKMTASEIQHSQDLLNLEQEPLSPEDIASIVSGSVSLLEDDDYCWDELLDELSGDDIGDMITFSTLKSPRDREDGNQEQLAPSTTTSGGGDIAKSKTAKKKELQNKLLELKKSHKNEVMKKEMRTVMEGDSMDGMQVFKPSYRDWKNKKAASTTF